MFKIVSVPNIISVTSSEEAIKACLHKYCIGSRFCNCRSNLKRGYFCGSCFGR